MFYMRYFHTKLLERLEQLGMSFTQLQYLSGIPSGQFSHWKKPKSEKASRVPTDMELEKLANVEKLKLSISNLRAWRVIDMHGPEEVIDAYNAISPDSPEGIQIREILSRSQAS